VAHQASNVPFPVPALQFSQLGRGLQAAYQMSEALEVKLPAEFIGTAGVFLHNYTGVAQLSNNCVSSTDTACVLQTVDGRAVGAELLVRRALTRRLTGWLSYTLSRAERDNFFGATGTWGHQLSEFDRTHVVNLVGAFDLGKGWRAGARFVAYSGRPYSTTSSDGPPDSRMPPFFRVDLRLEKRWTLRWGTIAVVAEWLNALLRKEDIGVTCATTTSGVERCVPEEIGPITIPSLGVEATF